MAACGLVLCRFVSSLVTLHPLMSRLKSTSASSHNHGASGSRVLRYHHVLVEIRKRGQMDANNDAGATWGSLNCTDGARDCAVKIHDALTVRSTRMSAALEFSLAQEQDFQQVLNICSSDAFDGLDYMAAAFHRWLQEPGRVVFIARKDNRVVALESALLIDGGQTAVFQGLRVVPDLRGHGIADALQKHVTDYIHQHYPQVSAVRLSRAVQPSPQTLAKYRLVAKEAVVSLRCEAVHLQAFVAELGSRLHGHDTVTLSQQQAETLILSDHVVFSLLPSKTIINDWEPLKPMEANMEVLRRRRLTWIVDRELEPSAISLCTTPYPVPYRHDALHFNINIFSHSVSSACAVFVAQLESLLPRLQGLLIFHTFVHPEVWSGLRQFCQNNAGVSFFKDYWEEVILERDL
ncbi:histidine N-acetyltransferase-like isoform X2 [Betta splendens]|uniref:Histidine N-acetyltransferase-like isoform X2 n=1 Tax=Betta splendens TaxID=158456 RepID=A0A6P7KS39_BETSP|nr:histidine N-acetyltransferase-like isoform X2 [Betta splendens]